ncbi:hypothetical protein BN1723_005534 [Verticillium longisporum]|uniref:Inositol polyphosphate-related phosphatase domain-containing protein n=1 Tax=Verticillium longisporum TaxID=100787 RepID=A0A0G4N9T2_VERLO|nr:hypothetical protein BN1723_005534 [Verticillium longisporum]
MAPPEENGPDGSSLKPVSSLRAKFENLQMTHPPEPSIGLSPPRAVSPAPKPERLREVKTVQENTHHAPAPRPPPKPRADRGSVSATYLPLPQHELGLRASTRSLGPPPPLSPKPTTTAPSVMIEPPHSPPKHMIAQFSRDDAPSLLNPDYIVAPTTPASDTAIITDRATASTCALDLHVDDASTTASEAGLRYGSYAGSSNASEAYSLYANYGRPSAPNSGLLTRVWSLRDGELLMSFAHGEGVKATSIAFKPGSNVDEEGQRLWIGTNMGEVMEADIATQSIVAKKATAHARHEVIKIYRHYNELWTLDESGTLAIWGPDEDHTPNLNGNPHQTYRLPRTHAFSMVVGDLLWHATGKEIRIFAPTLEGETQFQVLIRPLVQDSAGEVTSGTLMRTHPTRAFFGHIDGKVSIYNTKDFSCLAVLSISGYKINSLTGVGDYIWAGFNNGKISVYDISQTPWTIKKEWQAHENPVVKIISDPSSCYRIDRLQVISLGADNVIRVWDGLLQEDWQEDEMKAHEAQYCDFEDIKALVMTWNAGASTPHSLRYADQDATFIRNLLQSSDSPDILIFGFQELVDLEDKTATAIERFFKSKKKEGSDQERMSHQYRDWRDFLMKSLDDHMPRHDLYHLLHTATLVGLFTCIFVKSSLRDRIRNLSASEVKRGMGGLHGNKGAIVVRFLVDDTSMCFINCHLAAGQSQANSRHNDIAAILETPLLPAERDPNKRIDSYTGGGDGTLILDHELCVLNGDLNYRIDTMSRDTVVMAVKQNNLAKLLERDQLLVARRRNPGFRLRAFEELPIKFAPTYKYDVTSLGLGFRIISAETAFRLKKNCLNCSNAVTRILDKRYLHRPLPLSWLPRLL